MQSTLWKADGKQFYFKGFEIMQVCTELASNDGEESMQRLQL